MSNVQFYSPAIPHITFPGFMYKPSLFLAYPVLYSRDLMYTFLVQYYTVPEYNIHSTSPVRFLRIMYTLLVQDYLVLRFLRIMYTLLVQDYLVLRILSIMYTLLVL